MGRDQALDACHACGAQMHRRKSIRQTFLCNFCKYAAAARASPEIALRAYSHIYNAHCLIDCMYLPCRLVWYECIICNRALDSDPRRRDQELCPMTLVDSHHSELEINVNFLPISIPSSNGIFVIELETTRIDRIVPRDHSLYIFCESHSLRTRFAIRPSRVIIIPRTVRKLIRAENKQRTDRHHLAPGPPESLNAAHGTHHRPG